MCHLAITRWGTASVWKWSLDRGLLIELTKKQARSAFCGMKCSIKRNEAHFTYIDVYQLNVFEAETLQKKLPKCNFIYFCCYLYSALGLYA